MAENKTVPTQVSADAYVDAIVHPVRRRDAETLLDLLGRITGMPPRMWGPSIIGFGEYHYRYASGREGDMAAVGFSPRATSTTLYFADGFDDHAEQLARLGPHTLGKACLYIKDLSTVDLTVLEEMVRASYAAVTSTDAFGKRLSGPAD